MVTRYVEAVLDELRHADRIFSTYRHDSVISRLDQREITLADCPPEVAEVLTLAERAAQESAGAFAVELPVDPADPDGPRRLDPSGVVKGWAADRAAQHLRELDDTDHCLSAGGDIICWATPDRPVWQIGIENPHDASRLVASVALRTGAVATSGTARRGAHLVDARTGRPPAGLASVTVIGPSLTWADIDATAAYAQGVDAAGWLGTRPIHSALVITMNGTVSRAVPTDGLINLETGPLRHQHHG